MFTQEQLEAIKFAARKTKNQGELAILLFMQTNEQYDDMFTETEWNIVVYCAEECKRQHSGEMGVYDMVNAWNFAINDEDERPIDKEFIEEVGKLVEPIDNKNGFRTLWVQVGSNIKENPEFIEKDLSTLLYLYYEGVLADYPNLNFGCDNQPLWDMAEKQTLTDADRFYFNYENIHPFVDGNGRSGKILYNYLNGTLENPIMPPNFWGSSNP